MQLLQRYSVTQAPEDKKMYSRSNNGNMVTGMDSPNHDFFVAHKEAFPVMNGLIANSPLELYPVSEATLFGKKMLGVGLRYKTQRLVDEGRKEQIKQKTLKKNFYEFETRGDLQAQYEKNVLPYIREFRRTIAETALQDVKELGLPKKSIDPVLKNIRQLTSSLNLFKKVATSTLANRGTFDKETVPMADLALDLVRTVETVLYKTDLTQEDLVSARQHLLETWFDEDDRDSKDPVTLSLYQILDRLTELIELIPEESAINMMPMHRYNFNAEILDKLYSKDNVVLYRACDVQASTLLGNKLTEENLHQLKTYTAGQDRMFHYATKILESGTDWVTLEHFAASPRDRDISGIGEGALKNLDHTWQFILQGVAESDTKDVSQEDKYFEIYTKIRYYLKGVTEHEKGKFDTKPRQRKDKEMERGSVQAALSSQLANVAGWKAFFGRIIADKDEDKLSDLVSGQDFIYQNKDPLVNAKETWDELQSLKKL